MKRLCVAVLGGDGRFDTSGLVGCRVRLYKASRYGGNGEVRRLIQAVKAGGIDRVIVLTRWNGHPETRRVRQICRQRGIPVHMVK